MLALHARDALVAALASCLAVLPAQVYSPEGHRLFPPGSGPWDAVAGDMDGDGDTDLAVLGFIATSFLVTPTVVLTQNDGQGRFTPMGPPLPVGGPFTRPQAIALGDIDGDGDLDLVVGGALFSSSVFPGALYRNDGPAGFTNVSGQWPTTGEATKRLLLVDYDSDGDLDIVTCNEPIGQANPPGQPQPINRLYLNNGGGFFTDVTATRMPNVPTKNTSIAAGDLDGDGDIDLVVTTATGSSSVPGLVRILLQNAQGVLVEVAGAIPPLPLGSFYDVALTDHDLDGDLDLAVASSAGVQLFANNGSAAFTLTGTLPDLAVRKFVSGDFDGDSRVDLATARIDSYALRSLPLRLLQNTIAGFVDVTASHVEASELSPDPLVALDCDGDNDLDLWGGGVPQASFWHNDGQGHLLQIATNDLVNTSLTVAAVADVDGDGDQDLAGIEASTGNVTQVFFVENLGNGLAASRTILVSWGAGRRPRDLAWIDADLDGDLDLFVGVASGPDILFHNVGGTFVDVSAAQLPGIGGSLHVALGDIDGDGLADLVTAGGIGSILLGDGVGGFVLPSAPLPGALGFASDVVLLDYDQDGDLDVALSVSSAGNGSLRVLRNDWPAPFVDVTGTLGLPPLSASGGIAAVDIDRDGRRDLVVGNNALAGGNGVMVFRSVPGGFVDETATRVSVANLAPGSIAAVDIDGDGWPDLCCRDWRSGVLPLELHNIGGVLVPFAATGPAFGSYLPERPAAADLDGDGDQDIVHTFGTLRNLTRQLQNAVPPRLGLVAELVVHANGGNGIDPQAALLFVSSQLAAAPIAVPGFGSLHLDPATTSYLTTVVIPGTGGEATISYTVPSTPSVLGVPVFVQAAFVHEPNPASWRLGNFLDLTVRL